ncbi:ABC transporter ATP-binding protein [archaeon]|nr:ABC transporter ATP-binding protein [archaeon]
MQEKAISVKNLYKSYNGLEAVKGVSFDIEQGEFFGYLGPNGAGKTTTINTITGLANFDSGSVKVMGYDVVKDYLEARKLIGFSHQELFFDISLNVRQILEFQGGYFGMKGEALQSRVDELLKFFNLKAKEKDWFKGLSGGMKRKLQIAKALIHEPKILILDEPTAGIDVELRKSLWNYLQKINKQGMTIILTTHYLEEAELLCDRIGIIHKGKIIALDDKEKLLTSISKPKLRLQLKKDLSQVPQELKGKSYKVKVKNKILEFECTDIEKDLPKILGILSKKKIEYNNINVVKDKLEDVYLKLIGDGNEFDRF